MTARALPLGIDIGTTRMRVAELSNDDMGPMLKRIVIIDLEEHAKTRDEIFLGRLLGDALREHDMHERRCVMAVGEPDAVLRTVTFPPMRSRERERAARFEAMRHIEYPIEEAFVRSVPLAPEQGTHALGIVRQTFMKQRLHIARAAGLKPEAIDHESYALRRVFPYADAVLDMGHAIARLYVFHRENAPFGITLDGGAHIFTRAIARALSIDDAAAEHRKRSIGLSGAGEPEMNAFASSVGRALLTARNNGAAEIQRLIVTGNGARLPGLAERIERDTGCSVDVAAHIGLDRSTYPNDVARAAAPDWALCIGLALWSVEKLPS